MFSQAFLIEWEASRYINPPDLRHHKNVLKLMLFLCCVDLSLRNAILSSFTFKELGQWGKAEWFKVTPSLWCTFLLDQLTNTPASQDFFSCGVIKCVNMWWNDAYQTLEHMQQLSGCISIQGHPPPLFSQIHTHIQRHGPLVFSESPDVDVNCFPVNLMQVCRSHLHTLSAIRQ